MITDPVYTFTATVIRTNLMLLIVSPLSRTSVFDRCSPIQNSANAKQKLTKCDAAWRVTLARQRHQRDDHLAQARVMIEEMVELTANGLTWMQSQTEAALASVLRTTSRMTDVARSALSSGMSDVESAIRSVDVVSVASSPRSPGLPTTGASPTRATSPHTRRSPRQRESDATDVVSDDSGVQVDATAVRASPPPPRPSNHHSALMVVREIRESLKDALSEATTARHTLTDIIEESREILMRLNEDAENNLAILDNITSAGKDATRRAFGPHLPP